MTRQRRWQIKMRAAGRCMICGKMADGRRGFCRPHADEATRRGAPWIRAINQRNPLRPLARNILNRAVKNGIVTRPATCSRCGINDTKINAHHHDYAKPLEVTWLCYSCHAKTHREEAAA